MSALIGSIGSLLLWFAAMQAITWSWGHRLDAATQRGISIDSPALGSISVTKLIRGHTIGWTIGFLVLFTILAITDFPLWQRLGIAGVLSLIYGSMWFSQSEPGGAAEAEPLIRRVGSNTWYWLLAVTEWLGYLGLLCFITDLFINVLL